MPSDLKLPLFSPSAHRPAHIISLCRDRGEPRVRAIHSFPFIVARIDILKYKIRAHVTLSFLGKMNNNSSLEVAQNERRVDFLMCHLGHGQDTGAGFLVKGFLVETTLGITGFVLVVVVVVIRISYVSGTVDVHVPEALR